MFFDEQKVRNNDVGRRERLFAALQRRRIFRPFRRRMNRDVQTGEIFGQARGDAGSRAGCVLVQRHHNNVVGHAGSCQGRISAHNVPLPHIRFRR